MKNHFFTQRSVNNKQKIMDVFRGIKEYNRLKASHKRKHRFSEVIRDVGLFRFSNNQEFELPLPPRKRSFFPKNVPRLPARETHISSLLLTTISGNNVPVKLDSGGNTSQQQMLKIEDDDGSLGATKGLISSAMAEVDGGIEHLGLLVVLKFRGKTFKTKQWGETIFVPLGEGDGKLQDETIDLSLFDCSNVDLRHMGGYYDDEESISTEFRYLVSVSFSLQT